jgi:hypothetical protein
MIQKFLNQIGKSQIANHSVQSSKKHQPDQHILYPYDHLDPKPNEGKQLQEGSTLIGSNDAWPQNEILSTETTTKHKKGHKSPQ